MDTITAFVVYLTLFRLSIIAAGIISIVLGYMLFIRGVFPSSDSNSAAGGQNVTAEFSGAKFSFRNAAPGTCFAGFGVMLVVAMFITGGPQMTLEMLEKGGSKTTLRGEETTKIQSLSERALDYLEEGNEIKAAETVQEALQKLAGPLNDFAWVLLKTNPGAPRTPLLAKIAVDIQPQNPNFLHTLAEIQYQHGEKQTAIETLEKAHLISPSFSRQLERWRLGKTGN